MHQEDKEYKAIIWPPGSQEPGKRVVVWAATLEEARAMLEQEHGVGSVFDLHCPEDAGRLR